MASPLEISRLLIDAQRLQQTISVDPASGPGNPALAYMAQAVVWQALAGDGRPRAWKVGAPNRQLEPQAAPILPARFLEGPGRLSRGVFPGGVKVEAEIAVCFARDLPSRADPYSREEILAGIGSLHVAMEIVSSRLADPATAGPLWGLADNLYNGALVLGEAIPDWRNVDWATQSPRILADGQLLAEAGGKPPLDDLFHCLGWWLDHVDGAHAGDIVTTGAWSGAHPVGEAGDLRVEFPGLGRARLVIGD